MYFTIERAGLTRTKFRARLYGANHEQVWVTGNTYSTKAKAAYAIKMINFPNWPIQDRT